jgi:ParB-like nuclease domain
MAYKQPAIKEVVVEEIVVPHDRLRHLDKAKAAEIAASIKRVGQISPIQLRRVNGDSTLVTGLHRLEAARSLEMYFIKATCVDCSDTDARLIEIAENLHRADLTVQERSAHIEEWIRLTEAKVVSAQVAPKPQGGRPEAGVRAAARELGIKRDEARRAVKIANIEPEAQEAAREARLNNNQAALLKVASAAPEAQVAAVASIAAKLAEPRAIIDPVDRIMALVFSLKLSREDVRRLELRISDYLIE